MYCSEQVQDFSDSFAHMILNSYNHNEPPVKIVQHYMVRKARRKTSRDPWVPGSTFNVQSRRQRAANCLTSATRGVSLVRGVNDHNRKNQDTYKRKHQEKLRN